MKRNLLNKVTRSLPFLVLIFVSAWVFADTKQEEPTLQQRLRRGEVISDGGYVESDVWGKMYGVIKAPPSVIWKIFIESDKWIHYKIPRMIDSRHVSQKISRAVANTKKVKHVYKLLGDQKFSLRKVRQPGGKWTHDAFQYYDVPWPVKNRWMIVSNIDDETLSSRGIFHSQWTKAAGNINTMKGYFKLSPFEGKWNRTLLEYSVVTDPDAHVPKFLIKWGVKKIMPAVIHSIRREAARRWPPKKKPLPGASLTGKRATP